MFTGNNIYLKSLEKKDIKVLYNLYNDENVKKYNLMLNHDFISKNEIKNGLKNHCKNLRKALSIINEKGILIGFITYKENNYFKNVYSIGITIGSRYWNMGYGQDSIRVLIKYLFEELNAIRIELEVMQSNYRAIGCYKKCGFVEVGTRKNKCYGEGEDIDTIVMELLRDL